MAEITTEGILSTIDAHIPSLTHEDEIEMSELEGIRRMEVDYADLARRTCRCGAKIDGFYEYVDHLKSVFRASDG